MKSKLKWPFLEALYAAPGGRVWISLLFVLITPLAMVLFLYEEGFWTDWFNELGEFWE